MKAVGKKTRGTVIKEAGETEGARRATGVFPAGAPVTVAAPAVETAEVEVVAKAQRRRFTAEYKRRIVREADQRTKLGEIGALLRREGLYSSHLNTWRAARERGELAGLAPKPRGPKAVPPDPREKQLAEQAREITRLTKRAEHAEALVEIQKKVAALLGVPLEREP
jgi:transposase-like protein